MFGPVFHLEILQGSRRGRQHLFRLAYAGWLLAQFLIFYLLYRVRYAEVIGPPWSWRPKPNSLSELTASFVLLLLVQQLLLVFLALPAFAAATLTEEKVRGTLLDLLTTELTAREIVGGKLLGQALRLLDLMWPGWLILCFVGVFGGLTPLRLLVVASSVLAPLLALSAAGVLASVWCRKTSNAVLTAYLLTVLGAGLTAPLYLHEVFGVALGGLPHGPLTLTLLGLWLAWGGLAGVFFAVAVWRFRPASLRQLEMADLRGPEGRGGEPHPPVSDQPLWWKEQYVDGLLAVPVLRRLPRRAVVVAVLLLSLLISGSLLLLTWPAHQATPEPFAVEGLAVLFLFSLILAVRTSAAIGSEREKKTWEGLLLTPLTAKQLVRGKLWGTVHTARPYLVAYLVPAAIVALFNSFLAFVWVLFLWLLIWPMLYFHGAHGLAASVRTDSSWKALLMALFSSYRELFTRFCLGGLAVGVVGVSLVILVTAPLGIYPRPNDWLVSGFLWLMCLGTAILVFARAEQILEETERFLAQTERIPQGVPAWWHRAARKV